MDGLSFRNSYLGFLDRAHSHLSDGIALSARRTTQHYEFKDLGHKNRQGLCRPIHWDLSLALLVPVFLLLPLLGTERAVQALAWTNIALGAVLLLVHPSASSRF